MVTVDRNRKFDRELKRFIKNNRQRAEATIKALNNFRINPLHPGLNTEKLQNSDIFSFRIDKANRIFFVWLKSDTVLLIGIGPHDKYRSY